MATRHTTSDYGWRNAECTYADLILPYVLRHLDSTAGHRILDLGCGNGRLCGRLAERNTYDIVGVDPDERGLEIARSEYPHLEFLQYAVEDSPEALLDQVGDRFDVVISSEVVEHLFLPRLLPKFAAQVLRPGGHLILTTPYHGYLKNVAIAISGKHEHHYGPLWDGGHIKFWSRASLGAIAHEAGFQEVAFAGVGRVPYLWQSMAVLYQLT